MKIEGKKCFWLIIVTVNYLHAEGARILAVVPIFAESHHRFFQPLLKALARAGHEVVVYSPFPLDNPVPNYTDVFMDNVTTESNRIEALIQQLSLMPHYKCLDSLINTSAIVFDNFIGNDEIRQLLSSKDQFDLVFTEAFTGQEFALILGHIFKIPKHFPDAPPLLDMTHNVSLIFVNDHLTADYPRPRTPNIIPIAGIHIEDESPLPKWAVPETQAGPAMIINPKKYRLNDATNRVLPGIVVMSFGRKFHAIMQFYDVACVKDIQTFMDEATDGVILFSLGTYVPDDLQLKEYFDMYINVFKQLKQRVLWKTRKENIQGLPDNVMTLTWAPQRDVLAHPNCVLFITHGGLLSQHEATHCGVPVVAIPQFWDQYRNARFYEDRGVGVKVDKWDLTEQTVLSAVQTVLTNPQYRINMKNLSKIFRDRPMTPAQTVVYWTEYILRHGASHLRPASTQLSWYQLALLDVIAVLLCVFISVTLVIYFICRRTIKYICNERKLCYQIKKYN